jgi:hypothetical protein
MENQEFFDLYIDNRQRVNLSEHAYLTIVSDLLDFEGEKPSLSSAVSKVFLAYHQHARHDTEAAKRFTSLKPRTYVKEIPRLQNRVVEILRRQQGVIASAYGGSAGRYVKSVIEQYASLAYSERGRIFFARTVKELEAAIRNRERITVETPEGRFSMRPYRIDTDKITAHTYLTGYTKDADGTERMNVFRLSRIRGIDNDGEPGALSELEIDRIKDALEKRGVPFLRDEPQEIRIRLSDRGQELYSRLIHNRPIYGSRDRDIYTFNCTATQAEYYFFKFGAEAEVIEPPSLREKFITLYREAISVYGGSSTVRSAE